MSSVTPILFDNSYARLPEQFYARLAPTPVAAPALIQLNHALAAELGLDGGDLASPEGIAALAGNRLFDGSEPIAMAYAGHQFGNWVSQLGDGRAILLGEVIDRHGQRRDIQLKGSGRTPFSRGGDGRAWLGPVLREYLVSEAMAALGIPTTRALAAVITGETIHREGRVPGAILTRVGHGHIRVGTFEFFAARGDEASLRLLADHVIDRFYPAARGSDAPYLALFDAVLARQARLIAQWLGVGFIHGVMNTDNMSIAGETIDYGPCAFLDSYHPRTVYSYIDHAGRYAYGNQPSIAKWNLSRFVSTLLPLLATDEAEAVDLAQQALDRFDGLFSQAWRGSFSAKIGLTREEEGDAALIHDLLARMAEAQADFTQTFRGLSGQIEGPDLAPLPGGWLGDWLDRWRARLAREGRPVRDVARAMDAVNPAYIPRNHRVEQMITAAVAGDFAPFERLLDVLARPFDDQPDAVSYRLPPLAHEVVEQTFCGT